jgi:phage tail sheath protein FI
VADVTVVPDKVAKTKPAPGTQGEAGTATEANPEATGSAATLAKPDPLAQKITSIEAFFSKFSTSPKSLTDKKNFEQGLRALSPTYVAFAAAARQQMNRLPAAGAMAGIYSRVDGGRGVWKAPANVSLNLVNAPAVNISGQEQEEMNEHALTGKSINAIRSFPGIGTLVWGARTLDGNSQDWRYINVRRTIIMIEQSIKLSLRNYVFEPNDSSTWTMVKAMAVNFLTNLWKQGALAGSVPEQAFDVQIGLGVTMTPNDILDGYMRMTVRLAIVRPAEFITVTFQQMAQQS